MLQAEKNFNVFFSSSPFVVNARMSMRRRKLMHGYFAYIFACTKILIKSEVHSGRRIFMHRFIVASQARIFREF